MRNEPLACFPHLSHPSWCQTWGKPFHEGDINFTPKSYDLDTDTFVKLSRNNTKRSLPQSLSMLLPDATVLNGGGGLCSNCLANHYGAEIFTPLCLFTADGQRATRPEIINVINRGTRVAVGQVLRFQADLEIKSARLGPCRNYYPHRQHRPASYSPRLQAIASEQVCRSAPSQCWNYPTRVVCCSP